MNFQLPSSLNYTDIFVVLLVVLAATTDLTTRRIPNLLILAALVGALALKVFEPAGVGWSGFLLGTLTGFAIFFPLYLLRGMAAGDVKLMAAVGAFVGPLAVLKIALATCLFGGVMAIIYIACKGKVAATWSSMRALLLPVILRVGGMPAATIGLPKQSVGRMPYGLAIALGTITVLFWDSW